MSMSLAELRKELREARKSEAKPVSRMKKHEVALELERRKGGKKVEKAVEPESSSDEEVEPRSEKVRKVKKVLEKAKVPEAVVEKAVKKVEKKKPVKSTK